MTFCEVNFDGLVGPTHHYGGLSFGNIASTSHRHQQSNPRAAALQGLEKMRTLAQMGLHQAVLPPHDRPHLPFLHSIGFEGNESTIITQIKAVAPELLSVAYSASAMWTANAATVAPSCDTADRKVHITPANLVSVLHRTIEVDQTHTILNYLFRDRSHFVVHAPLPAHPLFGDEGAANHTRLCQNHGEKGFHLFVYGRDGRGTTSISPTTFPARQTRQASEAVARKHLLDPFHTIFFHQHPAAIDAGVFHNDVISVGNERLLLYHEEAYAGSGQTLTRLQDLLPEMTALKIPAHLLPLQDAVSSYLFNSQLVTLPDGTMALIAPRECLEIESAKNALDWIFEQKSPLSSVHYFDLRQSMHNGGGPACLRLRMVLNAEERAAVQGKVFLNEKLYQQLKTWIEQHYRDSLSIDDLADPLLVTEVHEALEALTKILDLGNIYPFQQV